ncbi:MAG: Rnf-Nqr domain containing protein [Oscillospiraceae bacterium]
MKKFNSNKKAKEKKGLYINDNDFGTKIEKQEDTTSFSSEMFSEVIIKNPVLISTIGLCPVVAICISLKSAIVLSIITFLTMIFAQVLSAFLFKSSPQWVRVALYSLSGMAVVAPSMLLLENILPENLIALGIYLPLLAINPLITRQCERVAVKSSVKQAFVNAVCCATGYSVVLIITGFLRELLGSGTIWDYKVFSFPAATALINPFGGFIVIGFMAALLRVYFKKIDPEYAEQLGVESRTAIKKPKQKKERPRFKVVEYSHNEKANPQQEDNAIQKEEPKVEADVVAISVEQQHEQQITEPLNETVQDDSNTAEIIEQNDIIPDEYAQYENEISQTAQRAEARKKIEYTSNELDVLLSQSLDDIINGTLKSKDNEATAEKLKDNEITVEKPKDNEATAEKSKDNEATAEKSKDNETTVEKTPEDSKTEEVHGQ